MLDRFEGDENRDKRIDALRRQKIVDGDTQLATEIDNVAELCLFAPGDLLIEQGGTDTDVFFILAGSVDVIVNGREGRWRAATDHVGEMATINPELRRSATIRAREATVVAKISEHQFTELAQQHVNVYRHIARELTRRLSQRNADVTQVHEKIRVLIASSAEALPIAQAVQDAFEHDDFSVKLWTDGVFHVSEYPLVDLEQELACTDFGVAIAHTDDIVSTRGLDWSAPRDNVILEYGMFLGRLKHNRSILMEPRGQNVKLPSDMKGLTTISYDFEPGADLAAKMAPACSLLRKHIKFHGPNN